MTTATLSTGLTIQNPQGTNPPATTSQGSATSKQDLKQAAEDLREAVRNNINQEIIAQQAQAAARAEAAARTRAQVQGVGPTPPAGPTRLITIQGRNGNTVIGVPSGLASDVIPPEAVDISIAFFIAVAAIIIGLPLARAFARKMDRRSAPAPIPTEVSSQLAQLNQAIDAIALEVERISEGQRYTTRLLSEQRDTARQKLSSGADR